MNPGKELLFCALGGSGEIGMNVNLYGADGKWLMVDLGMTFSDPDYPGVELVFADLEFIEERTKDLVGIVLTHAHEDHIGAVPYFAEDLGVPIYATPFTARLVRGKLEEAGESVKGLARIALQLPTLLEESHRAMQALAARQQDDDELWPRASWPGLKVLIYGGWLAAGVALALIVTGVR